MRYKSIICTLLLLLFIIVSNVATATPQSIDLNFIDEDVRVVLHTLATISNVDIVIDDSIKGNITILLKDTNFENALNLITSAKGLSYRKVGESFIIEPADMGTTEIYKLRYIRAVDIKKSLEPIIESLKLKAEIDEVSNSLIVSGSPTGCARIKTMLEDLDVRQQQIVMEAKVVVVSKTKAKQLGVDWTWSGQSSDTSSGIIKYGVSNADGVPYVANYTISALLSKGDAKILASPKLTTISGKEAHILIGDHIPVLTQSTSSGTTTTSIQYVDTGIKLTYTPTVTTDGTITAKVRTEVSSATLVTAINNYTITTREAETTVCMKDGETMVIGGLLGTDETKNNTAVPILSNIPLIGNLFKSVNNSKTEDEVIIFLTARVVK
jgi:type IV pilus assembly protein PilQ